MSLSDVLVSAMIADGRDMRESILHNPRREARHVRNEQIEDRYGTVAALFRGLQIDSNFSRLEYSTGLPVYDHELHRSGTRLGQGVADFSLEPTFVVHSESKIAYPPRVALGGNALHLDRRGDAVDGRDVPADLERRLEMITFHREREPSSRHIRCR
jgi:hypothetical protein